MDWDLVAEDWDQLQGPDGDVYRQALIHPAVASILTASGANSVLDIGSGNGCFLRFIRGTVRCVAGVEASPRLVELSNAHLQADGTVPPVWQHDIKTPSSFRLFDAASVIFSQQDVGSLESVLRFVAANLVRTGMVILVGEDYELLRRADIQHAGSQREWVSQSATTGQQRIWWRAAGMGSSIVTRLWTIDHYVTTLEREGWVVAHAPKVLNWVSGVPNSYRDNERFFIVAARRI